MSRVFLGVGSNEGDRLALISTAVRALGAVPGVQLLRMATVIETEPIGGPPQAPYLNTVVEIETDLKPMALLECLKTIERRLGRTPTAQRWAARPIDLYILLYHDRVLQEPQLSIPHPRLHERWFVLEPLAQLAPDIMHPVLKRSIAELLADVPSAPARPGTEAG